MVQIEKKYREMKKKKKVFHSPMIRVIEMKLESIVCVSGDPEIIPDPTDTGEEENRF